MSRLLTIAACCAAAAAAACNSKSPAPPVVTPPGGSETITGAERIGWDQRAGDAVELDAISYIVYIDGTRTPLAGVTCGASASAIGFPCSAPLPAMTAGAHTLQLAAIVNDGGPLESERSAALNVTMRPQTAGDLRPPDAGDSISGRITPGTLVTADGSRLRVELVAERLQDPADLAFTPDGRLLIAERAGIVRIVPREPEAQPDAPSGTRVPALSLAQPDSSVTLLSLAVDPQFDRARFVYALYTTAAPGDPSTFTLARFRESGGTLADRVVLLDRVPAAAPPSGALRFGPDGKLYAVLDDGGDPQRRNDRASLNGKVLRLNPDGTTPRDQAGGTPVYAEGYGSPAGLDWDAERATMWVVDRDNASTLRAVVGDSAARAGEQRGVVRGSYALPRASTPASLAFYRGDLAPVLANSLLVASNEGRHILKITGERVEALLQDQAGGITAVAVASDGAVYFANAGAVGRLVPDPR